MTIARKRAQKADGSLSTHNGFSLISDKKLLELYATMLKCRMLGERLGARTGAKGSGAGAATANEHLAVISGVLIDLQPRDCLAPSQGGFVPCFLKGVPPAAVLARATGTRVAVGRTYAKSNVVSPAFASAIQFDRATAVAAKENRGRDRRAAVIFCADADAGLKEVEGALKLAKRKKLPIVFVCWSDAGEAGLVGLARGSGVPSVAVDGNDAVAIYRVATEAIAHARRGSGPTMIDCKPWPARGRSRRNAANDSIRNMETYLKEKKLLSRRFKAQVVSDFERELDKTAWPAER